MAARLAVTFATSRKLGVPSLRYRRSHRLAAGSAFGEPSLEVEMHEL